MEQYKLAIGRIAKNGKTYMSLKGGEIDCGAKTVDFELPVQFYMMKLQNFLIRKGNDR
ncbi:hypothetical protein [Pedobacter hiemivivus]|nr:hypothetical protein [Pedobacter hiemivivus]